MTWTLPAVGAEGIGVTWTLPAVGAEALVSGKAWDEGTRGGRWQPCAGVGCKWHWDSYSVTFGTVPA